MQVLKRVEDVQLMCAKRRSLVVQQITKSKSRRSSGSSLVSTPGSVSSSGTGASQNSCFPNELKSAKSTSQLDYSAEEYSSSSLRSGSSSLSLDGMNPRNSGKYEESWEIRRVKRGHVLNELLQTERTYVEEIGDILHVRNGGDFLSNYSFERVVCHVVSNIFYTFERDTIAKLRIHH